jgi:hypothetical protein
MHTRSHSTAEERASVGAWNPAAAAAAHPSAWAWAARAHTAHTAHTSLAPVANMPSLQHTRIDKDDGSRPHTSDRRDGMQAHVSRHSAESDSRPHTSDRRPGAVPVPDRDEASTPWAQAEDPRYSRFSSPINAVDAGPHDAGPHKASRSVTFTAVSPAAHASSDQVRGGSASPKDDPSSAEFDPHQQHARNSGSNDDKVGMPSDWRTPDITGTRGKARGPAAELRLIDNKLHEDIRLVPRNASKATSPPKTRKKKEKAGARYACV